ncbi:kal-1 [Pristionchus pacificus]|nr:kal-1 [Pristionchus pacificus]
MNSEVRKAMKHHVVSVCSGDVNCSACTNPCSESFDQLDSCISSFCSKLEGDPYYSCRESCLFLQSIYSEKPGQCPSFDSLSTVYECAAACHLDGDCREAEKCCSIGCSRKCLQPNTHSSLLLPIPSGISVTERKRKRSAILRWYLKKLNGKQMNSLSNLFVVQWRWGLNENSMQGWQTILIKNKMYAILKHVLSPGRLYQFRIASVSIDGSRGFSTPSLPFKLSKEPKTPSAPSVTLGTSRLTSTDQWGITVQWTTPSSDLPIKHYQVSWEESTKEEASSFEGRTMAALKRNVEEEEEDSIHGLTLGGFGGKALRKSTIVPSHHTNIFIEGLSPNGVYLVEVHATVDSSEGEIDGEKGIVFITTSSLTEAQEDSSKEKESSDSINSLYVDTPHVEKGKLVSRVNWMDTKICTRRGSYVLRFKSESCEGKTMDKEWEEKLLSSCSTLLDGLQFDCTYKVEVHSQRERDQILSSSFSTKSCNSTPSSSSLCNSSSLLSCSIQSFVVLCHWPSPSTQNAHESIIGYRVSLISDDAKTSQISIIPPQTPQTTFQNLESGMEYTVEVQPITSRGIGSTIINRFRAPIDEEEEREKEESIVDHMEGKEIIELPLESKSISLFSTIYLSLLLILLCILL